MGNCNTKKWTSHILYICVCLHVQNMSEELNPGDPEFLFIQENNSITIKTTHSDPQLLRYDFVCGKNTVPKRLTNRVANVN